FCPTQCDRSNPARVEFLHERIGCAEPFWPQLLAIQLIIHSLVGKWFHCRAELNVKIGILVPPNAEQKKVPNVTSRFWRQLARGKTQSQFITSIQARQRIVAFCDQLVHCAISCAPTRWRDPPVGTRMDSLVLWCERLSPRQIFELAETMPMQV